MPDSLVNMMCPSWIVHCSCIAARQRCERLGSFATQPEHGKIVQALQFAAILVPPDVSGPTVTDYHNLTGAAAGLADDALVGQSHLDPAHDRTGQIFLPQIGFVIAADAFAKGQRLIGV